MFNERQKAMLRAVARDPRDPNFGKVNEKLEEVILKLSLENSKAFLLNSELKQRMFYHKPAHLKQDEYAGYLYL